MTVSACEGDELAVSEGSGDAECGGKARGGGKSGGGGGFFLGGGSGGGTRVDKWSLLESLLKL